MSFRNPGRKERLVLAAAVAAVTLVSSCGEFSVRPSLPPSGGGTQWLDPQEPHLVLSNMINVITEKDPLNYERLITEDFVFVPDPVDANELESYYPGVFLEWTADVEVTVASHMLDESNTALAMLTFSNEEIINETDSTHVVQENYSLILQTADLDLETYRGTARFSMRRLADGFWYIHKWEDFRLPDAEEDTWGVLRGQIRGTM